MGQLYNIRMKIEETISQRKLEASKTKGQITLKSGILLVTIDEKTPDDAAKIDKLKKAAKEVLNLTI